MVEDEPDTAEALSWGLAAEGYVVDVTDNGVDGLWKATENAYDVIVLDVMLPGLDGYQVAKRLREAGPGGRCATHHDRWQAGGGGLRRGDRPRWRKQMPLACCRACGVARQGLCIRHAQARDALAGLVWVIRP
jgi:hypothetical protein